MTLHRSFGDLDEALVAGLLARQFPAWAHLPLEHVQSSGTDNEIFRLGDSLAVRLPKVDWAIAQPEREHRWLPFLASHLPLVVPRPVALGAPDLGYPCRWSICEWLDGEPAIPRRLTSQNDAAVALAGFIVALQMADPAGAPLGGAANHYRGVPLARLDERVRGSLAELAGRVDVAGAMAAWDEALAAPEWDKPPVWFHGDLHPMNLLAVDGRLSAVIDFGLMGAGDPATDLTAAWSMFHGAARDAFRAAAGVDDDTWTRGRGWAIFTSVIVLPYYWDSNPTLVAHALRTLSEVLAG